jgi:plasmid stabilization system protein ParE
MAYSLAPQAKADLEDIAFYVFVDSGSLDIADRLIHSIIERFDLLAAYPRAGRTRDDLHTGVRGFPVGEYVLLYRVVSGKSHAISKLRNLSVTLAPTE